MMMALRILLTVFVLIPLGAVALTPVDKAQVSSSQLMPNPGFESGKSGWTASGGTFSISTSSPLFDKAHGVWDSSGAGQTLCSNDVAVPVGLQNGNGEAILSIQTPSGTATHTMTVFNGANVQASRSVVSSTSAYYHSLPFPFPASGNIKVCITSVNANEPSINIDGGHLGKPFNVGSTQLNTEWASFTPTGSWAGTTAYSGKWRQVGDSREFQLRVIPGSGPTGSALTVTISSVCTIDTNKLASGTSESALPEADGSMLDNGSYFGIVKPLYSSTTAVQLRANQSTANTTLAQISPTAPITWNTGDTIDASFVVPCVGLAAQSIVMPDAQGWWAAANIQGANPSLGVAAVTSYTEITASALTMTPKSGSAPIGIMCSGTNAATAPTTSTSTCAAGNESLGANFNIPRSGAYEVCTNFGTYQVVDSGEAIEATFQLIQTPLNAQTLIQEGGARTPNGVVGMAVGGGADQMNEGSVSNCGIFTFSAGNVGVRLMYEQSVVLTPDSSLVLTDGGSSNGQRDFFISVKPVSSQQQAILANSVSTGSTNGSKLESVKLNLSGASTVSIINQTAGWIQSVTASGSVPTITFTPGWWPSEPTCTVTCNTNAGNVFGAGVPNGTTSINVACINTAGVVTLSNNINVLCMTPR